LGGSVVAAAVAFLSARKLATSALYNAVMRWLVILCLVAIVASMASALVYLFKDGGQGSKRMLRALTIRVAISVGLFVCLMASYKFGLIGPNGVGR